MNMIWGFTRFACAMFALPVLVVTCAMGQQVTGSLVGSVTDSSDAVIVGARVVAIEVERNVTRSARTNESGVYSIASIEPGVYRIEVEKEGFKRFVTDRVVVGVNNTVRVDARMVLGAITESIQVAAEGAVLKTDRADLGTQISTTEVENLPLSPDRSYQSLLALVPGVSEPARAGSLQASPQWPRTYNVNGQNQRANDDRVEGTTNNQVNTQDRIVLVPPAEAIQAVDVTTNAYDAEHGNATGAIVNVVLKSGTNDLHGSLFEYNMNSALRARNTLTRLPPTPSNMNQFGFTLGGPIRRNRTFFFADYQGSRYHLPSNALLSVPMADYRAGNFSKASTILYDPLTGTSTGANRTAFPNNTIPAERISTVAANILKLWPLPNQSGRVNNYAVAGSAIQNRDAFDVKVNHNFSDRAQAFVSYSYLYATTTEEAAFGDLGGPATTGSTNPAVGTGQNQRLSLGLTRIFSPSLLAEFRAGFTRSLAVAESQVDANMATKIGIPGINKGDLLTAGLPQFNFTDYSFLGIGSTLPFKLPDTTANVVTNWTKTKGSHIVRWGAEFVDLLSHPRQAGATRGSYTFGVGATGTSGKPTSGDNSFGGFLLGLPTSISRVTLRVPGGIKIRQYSFFGQDRWQATRKLTVNYGLRYEVMPPAIAIKPGDQSYYDFVSNRILVAGYGPVNLQNNVNTDWTNFAPRFGLAYRLDTKTVIRSGYGISYSNFLIKNVNAFPGVITQSFVGANSLTPLWNIAEGIPEAPIVDYTSGIVQSPPGNLALTATNSTPRRGYVQSYNLTLQRDVAGFIIEGAYVGALGTRNIIRSNLNSAGPGAPTSQLPLNILFKRTANVLYFDYGSSSSYHALQAQALKRFSAGALLRVAYTWSKSIDYLENSLAPNNNLAMHLNRGVSTWDRTHNLVVSPVFSTPFGRGRRFLSGGGPLGMVLGGWRFNGVFIARSGTPFSVSGNKISANVAPGNVNRPNRVAKPEILGYAGPGQLYFDKSVFVEPAPGTWGNAGRNTLRGPGYVNLDGGVFRDFRLFRERYLLQFRMEAFNVMNTPKYANPNSSFTAAAFGQITSASGEREVRLGLRLAF
jgi:hypothetical protein